MRETFECYACNGTGFETWREKSTIEKFGYAAEYSKRCQNPVCGRIRHEEGQKGA